jgi:hypothetical protein
MYIKLPRQGALWTERAVQPFSRLYSPICEWDSGECHLWWGRLHVILTPPGWKVAFNRRRVRMAFSPESQRAVCSGTKSTNAA